MEKQIARAEKLLKNTGNIKRAKFISSEGQSYGLNKSLIDKTRLLLGIKGYYTNLSNFEVSDRLIIEHYHNLWHVEQAFRISKSDLQIRPVYHYKQQSIEVHILICFMALSICKYMELKASMSIKSILTQLKTVSDAKLVDTISGEEFVLRSPISDEIFELLKKLELIF
jgi:transposase